MKHLIYTLMAVLALMSCGGASVPQTYTTVKVQPDIYPDYLDVTIPVNIAPLTFMMNDDALEVVARLACGDNELIVGGDKVQPDIDEWHELLQQSKGRDITVDVYARYSDDQWKRYQQFAFHVSTDSIDPWLSY